MVVDPMQVLTGTAASVMATITPIVPTASAVPIPTVVPDKPEYQTSGETGHRTLWVVFIIMLISTIVFSVFAWKVPVQKRLFHIITTLITVFAALSYFAMASGHGATLHKVVINEPHDHVPDTQHIVYRQIFFARYIDWSITTPLLLLDLAILAGLGGAHIFITLVADVIMILTGLFAAYGAEGTAQKWGWYTIGCVAYLVIVWNLAVHGRAGAARKSRSVGTFYLGLAGFTLILWTLYPIVWGIADGARKVSVDGEILAYAVLDVLAKPVFGTALIIAHSRIPETQVDLGGFWVSGFSNEGQVRLEDDEGA